MTNEEIYKLACFELKKWQDKFEIQWMSISMLLLFGILCVMLPCTIVCDWIGYVIGASVIMTIGIYGYLLTKLVNKNNEIRRNYIYNLVRQDERNRCMTKIERYEHEGSK